MKIYHIEDMTIIRSYDAQFANIDPATGYICLTQNGQAMIVDMDSDEVLFTLPVESTSAYLLGGVLISGGYALDITPYLKRQ